MFAIIDLETTGLDPGNDRIIEVAILLFDGRRVVETFSTLVNPGISLPPSITRLTGITGAALIDAPRFCEIARKIVQLTEKCVLVGHNVRFDYGFLRREYGRLGYNFTRKLLCTERMSRQQFRNLPSYKLSRLCRVLGIARPEKHRALADAQATLELLQKLQAREMAPLTPDALRTQSQETILPPGLSRARLAELPEATGVYLFFDGTGRLLYIGKSNNIRKRVFSHFSSDMAAPRISRFKNRIREVRYEVTGSELVALLQESHLIKKWLPPYNRAQRHTRYRYGLFIHCNSAGYEEIQVRPLSNDRPDEEPLLAFSNKRKLLQFLDTIVRRHQLCQKLCGLYRGQRFCFHYHIHLCRGACVGEETPESYNRRVRAAFLRAEYPHANFFVVTPGRHEEECAIVMIRNGVYRGFGYAGYPLVQNGNIARLQARISSREDNQDVRRIIRQYLQQHENAQILAY